MSLVTYCHELVTTEGGERVKGPPGDGGGIEPMELRLDPAESTFGMLFVGGVIGGGIHSDAVLVESDFGEADSSRLDTIWLLL